MIFAHAFLGMIIAYSLERFLTVKKFKLEYKTQKLYIWLAVTIGAIFPDTDIIYVLFIDNNIFHRDLPSHWLFPYLILYLAVYLVFKYKKLHKFYLNIYKAFTIGVISHLLTDFYVDNIYFLKPLYNEAFMWQPFYLEKSAGFRGYMTSYYMFTEILIILSGQALMLSSFVKYNKEFKIMTAISIIILLLAVGFLLPFVDTFN